MATSYPGLSLHLAPLARAAGAPTALCDLRNQLLVFFSASAWARTQSTSHAIELRDATRALERAASQLRDALACEVTAAPTEITASAVQRFVADTDTPMGTLRRSLMLSGIDGVELLADLEVALARVRIGALPHADRRAA